MDLNIIDIVILLIILLGGVVGFKEGVIKKLATIIGLVVVIIAAFILKNNVSSIFYENLPFFDFWGAFKGIQVLNILFYELLAFVIIAGVLSLIYRLLLSLTGIIEKVFKATIILSIPSKILGFIVGLLEYYLWVYIALFILTLPIINIKDIRTSVVANNIIDKTPIVSTYTSKTIEVYNDIYTIITNRAGKTNAELNEESLEIMLKYDIITKESANKLIEKNKITVNDQSFLNNY